MIPYPSLRAWKQVGSVNCGSDCVVVGRVGRGVGCGRGRVGRGVGRGRGRVGRVRGGVGRVRGGVGRVRGGVGRVRGGTTIMPLPHRTLLL